MRYDERADGELLELAQSGWSPAFAVLVHRHAPALLIAFADDPDPTERVTDVFLRAMRQLPDQDPAAPAAPWLFALAGRPAPGPAPAVPAETLDAIWRELAPRWPDGKLPRASRRPSARKSAVVLGALALGVLVPLVVLGIPASSEPDSIESVRAYPLEDDPDEDPGPVDLPTFEFPDISAVDAEDDAASSAAVEAVPIAPPDPAPAEPVAPAEPPPPPPAETDDPEPAPVEPVDPPPATDDGTTDDGVDDGAADDGATDDGAADDGAADDGAADDGAADGEDLLPIGGESP